MDTLGISVFTADISTVDNIYQLPQALRSDIVIRLDFFWSKYFNNDFRYCLIEYAKGAEL